MKRIAVIVALLMSTAAHADEPLTHAIKGQVADIATTLVGTAIEGVSEANPLGVAGVVLLKPIAVAAIDHMDEPDRTKGLSLLGAVGYGAAANNLCVFVAVGLELMAHGMTAGSITALCLATGVYVGARNWKSTEAIRERAEFDAICTDALAVNPDLVCERTQ
jgi:hypothetical protein